MAGSFNHVINKKTGALSNPDRVLGMLETRSGDVYEAVEEMYGMIWWLAVNLQISENERVREEEKVSVEDLVEEARENYMLGLRMSPTKRFKFEKDLAKEK